MTEPVVAVDPTPTPDPTPAPEPTPEPTPASWRDGLEVDLKDNPSLTKFDDVPALAKSYVEQSALIGKKGLIPPDENSTPEQISEFHRALGTPETPEGYEAGAFQPPEALAEVWDANGVNEIAKVAHDLGVSKDQFNGLVSALAESQAASLGEHVQSVESNRESVTAALSEEWGEARAAKMDFAKRGFAAAAEVAGLSAEELAGQLLPDGGLIGDNAALTKIFAAIGEGGGEMALQGGKGGRVTMTPEEANTELLEINANPALYDRSAPEHKALVERRDALNRMAHPE